MSQKEYEKYYVPAQSPWPFMGACALFLIAFGAGNFVVEITRGKEGYGGMILLLGLVTLVIMLFGWLEIKSMNPCLVCIALSWGGLIVKVWLGLFFLK